MSFITIIIRPLYWLAGKLFAVWARPAIQPESPAELITDSEAAICYVLEYGGLADLLALDQERGTLARVGYLTNQPRTLGITTRIKL